ncbi:hypothetical protein BDZ91DRAFT_425121 [Kalaharituber pfeilii]|nr:hypothetical protein BDZ91DRAFT_425121 [Kalaharituber pfeilii]
MHNRQVVKRSTSDRRQHSGITSTARAPVNNRFPGKVTPLQPPQTSRPQSLPAQSFNIGQQQYMQLADSSSTNAASVEGENDSSVDSLTTSSPMGQMAKSLVLSDSDIPLESAERIAPSDTVTISEPIAHRKDSLAESEATEISIAQGKPRKAKAHRKRTKPAEFISTEQISDGQQVLLKGNSVDLPEPLNLETVIFFCAVCRRPRSSHHSVQCPLCGPNSTIRYCTTSCQRQDTEHWRLCGLTPFKVLITIQGKLTQSENRVSSWMTPALARQRMLLAEQTKVDYLLFSPNVYSPKYSLVLADEGMKLRFSKLREQLFQRHSLKTVVLLYRIIMSEVEVQSLAFTKEDLANQLFSEFGVNPLSTPKGKDLQITPNDWIDAGIV